MIRQAYPTIAAVILAAGRASRMGQPKQLLPWKGVPLVRRAAQAAIDAAGIGLVVVVTGANMDAVEAALDGLNVTRVHNPDYERGQSTSIHAGIRSLGPHVEAAMIMVADQPFVDYTIIERLVESYKNSGAPIVAPIYGDQRGNPVIFARSLWPEVLGVSGDQGAREVIRKYSADALFVHFPAEHHFDVDTPEDYRRLQARED